MNSQPLVSIVIPVYNGSDFLEQAIKSALNQTYQNIEILVVNDGSSDGGETRNIALRYKEKVRYFEKDNGGVASALNLGINEMRGDYFSWLSHDDMYDERKIETQINYASSLEDKTVILYSDFCFIDQNSQFINEFRVEHVEPDAFRLYFIMGGIIHGCTLLIPSVCFKECGMFNTNLRTTQDYELWFRFSEKFRFIHLPKILIKSRLHPNQGTVRMRPLVVKECNEISLHFIKSITRKEIISGYCKPVPIYYFDFAKSMLRQRYMKAMRYAFLLGILNLGKLRVGYIGDFFKTAFILLRKAV